MEKTYLSKDLNVSQDEFHKSVENDFIGSDFTEQLEWAMLMVQSNFKQIRFAEHLPMVTRNHFDKAYLMSSGLIENPKILAPLTDMQATPEIFPLINIKFMIIDEVISLVKYKELDSQSKRHLSVRRKYAFERAVAFYKKDTECFYGRRDGYEVNPSFFNILNKENLTFNDFPSPISLHPNFVMPDNPIRFLDANQVAEVTRGITMAYQVAFSMYYEWSIYIKEYDNTGLVIPIEPEMLKEFYSTSVLKFDSKKRMIHFVKDHYRRRIANKNEDYSIYIHKYLRGENKFNYNGFSAEIIPPKYELNRVKTKKVFIDPHK